MTKYLPIFILLFCACSDENKPSVDKIMHYDMRDYVLVGQKMDSVKPPYVIDVRSGNKRIVFIGCEHQTDSTHPQFQKIEQYFVDLKPQIAFNEGGQVADSIHFQSINEAIRRDGETGVLKFFADKSKIKMMNGDMTDSLEFAATIQRHSKAEMYLYYVVERIAVPYKYGAYGKGPFEAVFNEKIVRYFAKSGFLLTPKEQTFAHFKETYKRYMGSSFDIKNFDIEAFDYINDNCRFCAIGRTSKMVRDSVLLSKIDHALDKYDRVIVTFGHGHALAVEPALTQIMTKKR